jgi:hypothetical protein
MICPKYIFSGYLFLATHSKTNCSSLLIVAVISVAVVADMTQHYTSAYRHSGFTQNQWYVVSKD